MGRESNITYTLSAQVSQVGHLCPTFGDDDKASADVVSATPSPHAKCRRILRENPPAAFAAGEGPIGGNVAMGCLQFEKSSSPAGLIPQRAGSVRRVCGGIADTHTGI